MPKRQKKRHYGAGSAFESNKVGPYPPLEPKMPQLILFLIVAAIAWFGYRKFVLDAERLARQRERVRKQQQTGSQGTLVKDPATGEYRLKQD